MQITVRALVIEDPWMSFSHLSVENGLTGNYILDFLQDSEGYMWIATTNGLNRFDGYDIIQYRHDPLDSATLSDNLVTCLAEDLNGNLWVGTHTGLNRFEKMSRNFTLNLPFDSNGARLQKSYIRALLADSNLLWVETAAGELFRLNCLSGEVKSYKHKPPSMVDTYYYHTIFKAPDGEIFLGGRYMDLLHFDPVREEFAVITNDPEDENKKRDEDAACYFVDSGGNYWVGGIDGLYTFDPGPELFVKKLTTSTFSIAEPITGQVWAGTGSGLFILDIEKNGFRVIRHNDNLQQSLSHNHITKIYIDKSGNIWLGTLDGVSIFQPSQNKFRHIYHVPENENTPASNHITAIIRDNKNRLWVGSASGLECFDEDWNKLYRYAVDEIKPFTLSSNEVSTLMVDSEGDIWAGQWSGRGFNIVNPDKRTNRTVRLMENELKADWYNDFLEDSYGNIWLGVWGGQGLYLFDKNRNEFLHERFIDQHGMLALPIKHMVLDDPVLWLGFASQNRFYCFDTKTEKTALYSYNHYHPFDFTRIDSIQVAGRSICFYTDQETYIKKGRSGFSFTTGDPPENSLDKPDTMVHLKEIRKAIGTDILDFAGDSKGYVWVATYKGLFKTTGNLPVGRYHRQDGKSHDLPSDTIYSLVWQPPGLLWLGTHHGLAKFNTGTGRFENFRQPSDKYISSHLIKFVFEDSQGMIWIGTTDKGLNRLEPETRVVRHFHSNTGKPDEFWGREASCMVEDVNGNLWIGGYGLNKWDPATEKFIHFTTAEGLADNGIRAMLCDRSGKLWISTASGLSCFDPEQNTCTNFNTKDGLQDNEFSAAACDLGNGLLAFGGKNGINIFDPDNIMQNEHPPQINLSKFQIFGQDHSDLIRNGNDIRLKYRQNNFQFSFIALDYSDPGRNSYAYKLENFDNHWIETSASNRTARYTNVDPGKYIFRVKAANNDGVWNETGISVPLIITPPFWRTRIFYFFILTGFGLLIYLWIKQREKKIRDQNRVLVLEQKVLRSQMNPHFIFNSLGSIQSFIFENNPVVAGSYLSRFAELIRSILYNSREEFITLNKEIQTLENYLELQQLRYNNKFTYEILVKGDIETETLKIPPMMAQPFIENAIEHGLKELDRPGELTVVFTLSEGYLLIRVQDNGRGREKAGQKDPAKSSEHKSLATVITRERIDVLNKGRKNRLYSMKISDRLDMSGNNEGTIVEIMIPVK